MKKDNGNVDLRHYKTPFILLIENGSPVIASESDDDEKLGRVLKKFAQRFNAKYTGSKLVVRDGSR